MTRRVGVGQTGSDAGPAPIFVREHTSSPLPDGLPEFDVVVAGGTLGIFLATSLQVSLLPHLRQH